MEVNVNSVEIGILKIQDNGFMINESLNNPGTLQLDYNLGFGFSQESDWVEFTVIAEYKSQETKDVFLSGNVSTRFLIKDLKKFIGKTRLEIPKETMITMFSISFTHARSIMAKNSAGSKHGNLILPIVNPAALMEVFLDQINLNF